MLSLLRLECKQKKLFQSIWNLYISLSFLLIWNWNDKCVHTLHSTLKSHTRFQTKMGLVYTGFKTITAQNPYLMGRIYLYGLYKGIPSPPGFIVMFLSPLKITPVLVIYVAVVLQREANHFTNMLSWKFYIISSSLLLDMQYFLHKEILCFLCWK